MVSMSKACLNRSRFFPFKSSPNEIRKYFLRVSKMRNLQNKTSLKLPIFDAAKIKCFTVAARVITLSEDTVFLRWCML